MKNGGVKLVTAKEVADKLNTFCAEVGIAVRMLPTQQEAAAHRLRDLHSKMINWRQDVIERVLANSKIKA